jgi:diguanylate cyclase (GGDEF)-like protein
MLLAGRGQGVTAIDPALLTDLAYRWAASVRSTCRVELGPEGLRRLLHEQLLRLADALRADPFTVEAGYAVGEALVAARLSSPEALQQSIAVFCELPAILEVKPDAEAERTAALLGALCAGFAAAVQEEILGDQERALRKALGTLAQVERELHHQAHHDPLTGLPNRLLLYRHLEEALRDALPGARIGLCFIDLDEFKTVNDTLGHTSGDRLLVAVAARLRNCVDGGEHFVARVGGDEFVVVVRGVQSQSDMTALATSMLESLAKPVRLDGHELSVSASIGIVEQPVRDGDVEELLRAADATLHLAKADGRARWAVFDAQRNAQQLLQYGLTGRLAGALERGEFALEYQPLVSLVDCRLRGAEALLRWHHPDLGTLSPNTFVPVAERSGMIGMLGRWVLREACDQAAAWQRRFPDATPLVSVNVSGRQCTDPGLLDEVTQALADSGLAPANLQLELTETVLMQSYDRTYDRPVQTLRALSDLGVRIVIDDFGIGYSNLAYLRHLPVHGLKLAGAFMAGIRAPASDRVDEQIVETVIGLAHTLGMTVTAEGVENADQASRLAALGCDLAQGWHFGRPGSGQSIEHLAEEGLPSMRVHCGPVRPRNIHT